MSAADDQDASPPPESPAPFAVPRRLPRYKLDVRVRVSVPRTGQLIHARSADISEHGLAFFAPLELELKEAVELEFTLPYSRHPQRCAAMVRNRSGYRYGVEFEHLSATARQAMARACTALALLTD